MLKDKERESLREHLDRELTGPVKLTMFTQEPMKIVAPGMQECEFCAQVRELVEELAELSEHLTAEIHEFRDERELAQEMGIDKIPAVAIIGAQDYGARFYGALSGYEFAAFLETLFAAAKGESGLAAPSKEALAGLTGDVHIQVFGTPTCPYCPRAALVAMRAAIESPRVRADVVEAIEFPHLANRYGVRGVPHVVLNEVHSFTGALPEDLFIGQIVEAAGGD